MYLRFVTTAIDEDSRKPQGVFVAAYLLLNSGDLNAEEWQHLRANLDWFNEHLPPPPKNFTASRAIFWFRSSSTECIDQIWEIVELLRRYGRFVEVHQCRRLANIRYRDALQVAAYPSDDDAKISIR